MAPPMPVVDLAAADATLARWAFVHPIAMAMLITFGLVVYGTGLRLQDRRRKRLPADQSQKDRHGRLAKPFVLCFVLGLAVGPLSAVTTRGWPAMSTIHGWLGLAAALVFAAAGFLGLLLDRGRSEQASLHGLLAVFAGMLALAAAVAGIELLP